MGSTNRATRDKQLQKAEAVFNTRKQELSDKGINEKAMSKDPKFKALQSKLKEAKKRIRAIETASEHVLEVAGKDVKCKKDQGKKPKAKKPKTEKKKK